MSCGRVSHHPWAPPVATFLLVLLTLSLVSGLSGGSVAQSMPSKSSRLPASIPVRSPGLAQITAPEKVDPFLVYNSEPAPMGIADFGVGSSGAYSYATNSSLGVLSISSLSVDNGTGDHSLTAQLNVNLEFTSGRSTYVYWIQDVAYMTTNNNTIQFVDNVWNSSSPTAVVGPGLSGSGQVAQSGNISFYFDVASLSLPGNNVALSYPSTVYLEVNATVNPAREPQVAFAYNDGHGWQVYDRVVFTGFGRLASLRGFVVDGFDYNPFGVFADSELVLVGPGNGASTNDVTSDVKLQLEFWNGHNYQQVTNAYNFGSDTAETLNNAVSSYSFYPDSGQPAAELKSGPGALSVLYGSSQVGTLSVSSTVMSGVLEIRSLASPTGSPSRTSFVDGNVTVVLSAGEYVYQIFTGGTLYSSGNATVAAGSSVHRIAHAQNAVSLTLGYSIRGGSAGSSSPVLKYVSGGVDWTAYLTTLPTTYYPDPGTSWSVSSVLPGSAGTERWATAQPTTGVALTAQNTTFVYYHQFEVSPLFTSVGGSPPSAPVFSYQSLGSPSTAQLAATAQSFWADSGSQYSVPAQIASTAEERWSAPVSSGTVGTPLTLAFTYHHQFLLTVVGENPGSQWQDSGKTVNMAFSYSWNSTSGSRANAFGYTITQPAASVALARSGTGTFTVAVNMTGPETLTVESLVQFNFTVSGGYGLTYSANSPTHDSFYDRGTNLTVSTESVWGTVAGNTRRALSSYSLDGVATTVNRSESGAFTAPVVTFDSPHSLSFGSVTQYLVGFRFEDASGSTSIVPSSFVVELAGPSDIEASGPGVWLDSGANFTIRSLTWEGTTVGPVGPAAFTAFAPVNESVRAQVYEAKVEVDDYLGIPVPGAAVTVTFANGTSVQRTTTGDGTLNLGLVPLGTLSGTASFLGSSSPFTGDVSRQTPTTPKVLLSYPTLLLIVAVLAAVFFAVRRMSKSAAPSPPGPNVADRA